MADWTPIAAPAFGQNARRHDSVRILNNGSIYLSAEVATGFNGASFVVALKNGRRDVVGLMPAATRAPNQPVLKLSRRSGGTRSISGANILTHCGKEPVAGVVELPHHWDGDVLVIDLSGLPDATGGR